MDDVIEYSVFSGWVHRQVQWEDRVNNIHSKYETSRTGLKAMPHFQKRKEEAFTGETYTY